MAEEGSSLLVLQQQKEKNGLLCVTIICMFHQFVNYVKGKHYRMAASGAGPITKCWGGSKTKAIASMRAPLVDAKALVSWWFPLQAPHPFLSVCIISYRGYFRGVELLFFTLVTPTLQWSESCLFWKEPPRKLGEGEVFYEIP